MILPCLAIRPVLPLKLLGLAACLNFPDRPQTSSNVMLIYDMPYIEKEGVASAGLTVSHGTFCEYEHL